MTAGGSEGTEPTWLTEVRLRIARRVLWLRALWAANCHPGDEAVAIGHGEVDRTLQPALRLTAAEQRFYREDAQAAGLTDAIDRLADAPLDPRWDHLVTSLGLTPQEANLVALALAVHAVPGMRRVFGYLQDGTAPADASIGLAAALWGWPPASLARHRIGAHTLGTGASTPSRSVSVFGQQRMGRGSADTGPTHRCWAAWRVWPDRPRRPADGEAGSLPR